MDRKGAQPVVVVPYDPGWPGMFERERRAIQSALTDLEMTIEHIGSTAVPGLAAKPKIDILAGLQTWDDLEPTVDALLAIGYGHEQQLMKPEHFCLRRARSDHTSHRFTLLFGTGTSGEPSSPSATRYEPTLTSLIDTAD